MEQDKLQMIIQTRCAEMNVRVRGMPFGFGGFMQLVLFSLFISFKLSETEDLYNVQLFYFMSAVKIKKKIGILRKSPNDMP